MARISFTADLPDIEDGLRLTNGRRVSRGYFLKFIEDNPDLRTELTAEGELIVMPPAHFRTDSRNAALTSQLYIWAQSDGRGSALDATTGFNLPNGATRAPDASWVLKSRLDAFGPEQREAFLPLCPDFVVELRSKSDRRTTLQAKMHEYLENGARLGWLIDPQKQQVLIYRPQTPVETLNDQG